ncbi:hypothetical protein CO134_03500 [Candidatus Kuenenbacteria bacterium CG_4_9_14_3_um_filter_39_14]|uniref:Multifunctional fusion protein n=5 Tax=Candidatus Kueneniibacteriota TaxID=1752740 RepID=A0A2M7ILJ5_9BACT|nr:MAG: hypothetical protein COX28_00610 [Candidatus Kuenenbacteria bacterium CG23_combo_of_CG06-09_8_20_14_all_39_39]PIR80855.1 MAG: hypothetical protein COU24_01740 [Candidatus Kuenenbacteria bacterium CG10_big_fil_rev_8_21_14_0_10_39_14]PIW95638.1 MAG: hypothetical protein COZ84_02395 [Candidatus Kuenenbacteria bacterium CG_4_8_14_3_um_filter_39_15]PJA91788.1 MAG: hypothetical protein CO134_03500 [Candidatus Kuenenbacteria bacterium CG_4_9_14_3_um_filter_39_14]
MPEKIFKFDNYNFNPASGIAVFGYSLDKIKFKEKLIFPKPIKKLIGARKKAFNKALFNLFLITGISYYKTYCPKKIELGKYKISKEQAKFWNKVYTKGLGQFFYENRLDFRGLIDFPYHKNYQEKPVKIKTRNRSLVPLGGGKDSIVVLEKMKENGIDFDLSHIGDSKIVNDVAKKSGKKIIFVKRKISPNLFSLNKKKGVYNGHIPISACHAFILLVRAILYDYRYIVMGNEKSSSYGNIKYLGTTINHQWSKSAEFEKMFSNYLKKFITPNIRYYSFLRNWDDLAITKEFVKHKKYFPVFSSCNKNFKLKGKAKNHWCNDCPKCVFTFTMLSAYLSEKELVDIFGKNLYQERKLKPLFDQLLGKEKFKPFECVGTPEAMKKAMAMARKKILILGFAREGLSSYKYLRKKYRQQLITVADAKKLSEFDKKYRDILKKDKNLELKLGKNYLKNLDKYNLIIKTAGIKLNKKNIHITTNLNIFLENIQGKIIGVTGTKGKSTTASLIDSILKAANKKVVLVGNIGKPFLDYLKLDSKNTIYVAELSSHQLDTLKGGLDVGVFTSFYPEHLDYHGNLKNYWQAKMNLVKNSKIIIVNKKIKKINRKKISYGPVKIKASLLGRHNQENIAAAMAVAKLFKIKKNIINKTIKNFKPLEHRLEYVGKYKNINFYNDVLSTTPESTMEAINALQRKNLQTIIVGGFDRGLDYKNLAKKIVSARIKNVIYWPHTGEKIIREIKKIKSEFRPNLIAVKNMEQTIKTAYKYTPANFTVLLSPAAASYNFYQNYQEKGKEFKKLVKKFG